MPKLNANLSMMFNEVDFPVRFDAAAKAGFKGVEFLFPYAYDKSLLVETLERNRLEMVLFNMPPGDWEAGDRGMACDPARSAEFQDNVGLAVDYALALNCKKVHCMAGLKPRGVGDKQMRDTYIANLQFAGKALAKHGISVLIEAINTRDIPGFYLNYSEQAFDIMHYADVPNLAFQFDIYHMQIMEGDLGNYALCGRAFGPRFMIAWPSAQIAVMGGDQAADTILSIEKAKVPEGMSEEAAQAILDQIRGAYEATAAPYHAAAHLWVDAIIDPRTTRDVLKHLLRVSCRVPPEQGMRVGFFQV